MTAVDPTQEKPELERDPPTEEGWYWFDTPIPVGPPIPAEVQKIDGRLCVLDPWSAPEDAEWIPISGLQNCYWAGPFLEPEGKTKPLSSDR